MSDDFDEAMRTGVIPDFPECGLYRQWDEKWSPSGYAAYPHHKGQPPMRFPPHWTPLQCFRAGGMKSAMWDAHIKDVSK
jgi:hypothetical protein